MSQAIRTLFKDWAISYIITHTNTISSHFVLCIFFLSICYFNLMLLSSIIWVKLRLNFDFRSLILIITVWIFFIILNMWIYLLIQIFFVVWTAFLSLVCLLNSLLLSVSVIFFERLFSWLSFLDTWTTFQDLFGWIFRSLLLLFFFIASLIFWIS